MELSLQTVVFFLVIVGSLGGLLVGFIYWLYRVIWGSAE